MGGDLSLGLQPGPIPLHPQGPLPRASQQLMAGFVAGEAQDQCLVANVWMW